MPYFPMFINLKNEHCLVVGGGSVALHKVRVLLDFGAHIKLVADQILSDLPEGSLEVCRRRFETSDLEGCAMVIAATGDESLNHEIAELCRARGIPINSVDQPEDCTFIFPSYIRKQNLVGAISSGGNSPVLTQYLKERLSHELTDELGEIGEYMGDIRAYVREEVPEEGKRRQLYRRILNELIENGETSLPKERLLDLISEIQQ